ncbi:hypothetical protein D3C79_1081280 [compost metagenome]
MKEINFRETDFFKKMKIWVENTKVPEPFFNVDNIDSTITQFKRQTEQNLKK